MKVTDGVEVFYDDGSGLVFGDKGGVMHVDEESGLVDVVFWDAPPAGRSIMCGYYYLPD